MVLTTLSVVMFVRFYPRDAC